jgi:hypothetical protein
MLWQLKVKSWILEIRIHEQRNKAIKLEFHAINYYLKTVQSLRLCIGQTGMIKLTGHIYYYRDRYFFPSNGSFAPFYIQQFSKGIALTYTKRICKDKHPLQRYPWRGDQCEKSDDDPTKYIFLD